MVPMNAGESGAGFRQQLLERFLTRWRTKMAANTFGMLAFFGAYFWVLDHPFSAPYEMPLTAIDGWIGTHPSAILLYATLWVYVSLPLALLMRKRDMASFGVAAFAISAIGLGIFMLWPTTTAGVQTGALRDPMTAFLKDVDGTGNACPSLHVAFAVFTAVWLHRLLREMGLGRVMLALDWLWCAAILYSTVATRQHVALDVVAGAVLGACVVAANLLWLRRADLRRPTVNSRPEGAALAA